MVNLKDETRRILETYDPQRADEMARALEALWSQVPIKEGGAALVKAEIRAEMKALGVPVPALAR